MAEIDDLPDNVKGPPWRDEAPDYLLSVLALHDAFLKHWPAPQVAFPGEATAGRMFGWLKYQEWREPFISKVFAMADLIMENPDRTQESRMDWVAKLVDEMREERVLTNLRVEELIKRGDDL